MKAEQRFVAKTLQFYLLLNCVDMNVGKLAKDQDSVGQSTLDPLSLCRFLAKMDKPEY